MNTQKDNKEHFSFQTYAWKQFKSNKVALASLYLLGLLALIAICAPYIANDRPLYVKYKGESLYPAFSSETAKHIVNEGSENEEIIQYDIFPWKQSIYDKVIWAPIAYSPNTTRFIPSINRIVINKFYQFIFPYFWKEFVNIIVITTSQPKIFFNITILIVFFPANQFTFYIIIFYF